jgi:RNA polymerase sporulation-specific sigma factor
MSTALVLRARGGDELAFRRLIDRYRGMLEATVRDYFAPGHERADLRQEALYGLHKAVRDYRPGKGANFGTFAHLCVKRQVITAVKGATRGKHGPLNHAALLSQPVGDGDRDTLTLAEVIADRAPGPDEQLFLREELHRVRNVIQGLGLSEIEREAILGFAQGLPYEEIADRAGVNEKSIDNALQRVRRKLRRDQPGASGPIRTRAVCVKRTSLPRRRRRPSPTHDQKEPRRMSIVESIDAEISGIDEEIVALEAQLGSKRTHREGLQGLRKQAESLQQSEGGGLPERPKKPPAKPRSSITQAEKDVVACLGSGRTAREAAATCDIIAGATNARAILEGLVRRNVIRRREGSDPAVYEPLEQAAPAI